jgi:hypothetical protein
MKPGFSIAATFLIILLSYSVSIAQTATLVFDGEQLILQSGGDNLMLGEIKKGANASYSIRIVNKSAQFFHFSNVRGSCGLSVPTWPRNGIEPGKEALVQIRYDSSRLGKVERNLTMYSNALQPRYILKISADVVPVL